MNKLNIIRPDDWHVHLRDTNILPDTVRDISRYMGRAIIMPNLIPPITDIKAAKEYQQRINAEQPRAGFAPLMTLYLTDNTSAAIIQAAKASNIVYAAKLYPAGATTNSNAGVTKINNIYPALESMQESGMPLLVHGEVTQPDIDIFDREKVFIDTILSQVINDFPELKVVLEHITTKDAADYVAAANNNLAATITVHHLLFNRNHLLAGGIKPHFYCLPILKRDIHQQALIEAAISGNSSFFLGTDSAPHNHQAKESACGCAGCYTAHASIELYAEVFEAAGALDKLEGFSSFYGADFYGLPRNKDRITLLKQDWHVPSSYPLGESTVIPIKAGETISWKVLPD